MADREREVGTYDPLNEAHRAEQERQEQAKALEQQRLLEETEKARSQSDALIKRGQEEFAQSLEAERSRGSEAQGDFDETLHPQRPASVQEKQLARLKAELERREREQEAQEQRESTRAAYMREHHHEEYAAEQQGKQQREEREARDRNVRQEFGASALERTDGVFETSPEQHQQTQQQQAEIEREGEQKAQTAERERPENADQRGMPEREKSDRQQERAGREREQGDEAQRRITVEWLLAKRAFDRARDRDDRDR
jgi:peptidoglycan hydrolase-like protein with peptidoglycan-binding domain